MAEQLPDVPRDGVRVIVSQRVVDKILRGALLYPEPETGEALVGLVVPQAGRVEPDIYILDTISPGEHAVREWGMFEQGDDWQGDVFHWLYVNWEAFRELRRSSYGSALAAKWDVPLMHVGDWHKQPDDMTAPSPGDAMTAREMIADAETPVHYIVAPIVTMYPLEKMPEPVVGESETTSSDTAADGTPPSAPANETSSPKEESNTIASDLVAEGWHVRVDFWYMSKHRKHFVPVTPVIWPSDRLPILPPVAWHLAHPKRFDQEYTLMVEAGYSVDVVRWDADGKPPYEICFSVYKSGNRHVLLLVTPVDYPAQMPAVRIAPLVSVDEGQDVFERLYEESQPALMTQMPEWPWDSKRTLVELVWHFESLIKQDDHA